ncbi:hypothetical protein KHS38_18540 [Mucilaginibacter sp. Bleaf8]|uniref:hypothetical protein n=1 Tax=Mucilaginibacter sp. Bleaf8 TaxID=2834430 RepID=UPI001BCEE33D|nr:hypothetical protein [Mucilaginibacter sp. Bleaf8]MBS7566414.1 hypothetical protein [Mucilaginibacter sp. Bleaf8]
MRVAYKIILSVLLLVASACTKPTEDIKIIVDTNIIKYTALIHVTDGATGGIAPAGAQIKISGGAAQQVYELSGKKDIHLTAGTVTIGLGPDVHPAANQPISITVEISAAGYKTVSQQVTFTANQLQQIINIGLIKTGSNQEPVSLPPPTVYMPVSLNFTGTCASRNNLQIRPSVYVFFKETGSGMPFQYLGYVDKGDITTSYLALGKTYDFQITYGGESHQVRQKIEQASYNLTIDMGNACNNF